MTGPQSELLQPTLDVEHTVIDAVRTYWVPGRGQTLSASLMFRVGSADLSLATHGRLHLLEHLALHGRDSVSSPVNGSVDLLITSFDIAGRREEVVTFLADLCQWLAEPSFSDVEHERRVLAAEQELRRPGAAARHLLWRYGAGGPGLVAFEELGLRRADEAGLRELASASFTTGNAVLVLNGEPPASLRLPLKEGLRSAPRPAMPCEQSLPGGFTDPVNGIGLSGTVPRSSAATLFARTLHRELQEEIRAASGMGYSAWSSYEVVDSDTGVIVAGIDVLPEGRIGVVECGRALVRRLAVEGPRPDALAAEIELTVRQACDAPDRSWLAWAVARADLLGGDPFQPRRHLEELRETSVEAVREVARSFEATMLIGVDRGTNHGALRWLDGPPNDRPVADGRTYRAADAPIDRAVLTVSDRHIQVQGDRCLVVEPAELAVAVAYPDGGRTLVRRDGYQLTIEPTLWRNGSAAVAAVDSVLPAHLVVPMPERDPHQLPQPRTTARQRLGFRVRRTVFRWQGLTVLALLLAALGSWAALTSNGSVPLLPITVISWCAYRAYKRGPNIP